MKKGLFLALVVAIAVFANQEEDIDYLSKGLAPWRIGRQIHFPKLNLAGRNLSKIKIPEGSQLSFADARGVNLEGASARYCNFQGANFSPFEGVAERASSVPKLDLSKVRQGEPIVGTGEKDSFLDRVEELDRVERDLESSKPFFDPSRKQLTDVIKNSNLKNADFTGSNFVGANLFSVNAAGANFAKANFKGANLSYSNLAGANLKGADLRAANLSGAYLNGIELLDIGVNEETNFIGAKGLRPDYCLALKEIGLKVDCNFE